MNFNGIIAIVKSVILKNYVNFEGRATRAEFWWFFLFNFLLTFILGLLGKPGTILSSIWSIAILLPQLGLGVRRLHDIGKSGWYWLIALIPIVGWILVIIWFAKEGDPNDNQYGPVPTIPTAE